MDPHESLACARPCMTHEEGKKKKKKKTNVAQGHPTKELISSDTAVVRGDIFGCPAKGEHVGRTGGGEQPGI